MTTRIVTDINGRKHITNEPLLRSSHRETVSNQPEALRLADLLDNELKKAAHHEEAAAELRRQHAEIERLGNLCYDYIGELTAMRAAKQMQQRIDELKAMNGGRSAP